MNYSIEFSTFKEAGLFAQELARSSTKNRVVKSGAKWIVEYEGEIQDLDPYAEYVALEQTQTSEQTKRFYHFTDSRNLPSIGKYGLLSWKRLLQRRIDHWPASNKLSRELDERAQLGDYIRLCTKPEHPMAFQALREGRIKDYVWLTIDGVVSHWKGTKYSSENATSNRATINGDPKTALGSASIQAEVLVHGGLNVKWIDFRNASAVNVDAHPQDFSDFDDSIQF